jgi:hypothetical protein
MVKGKKKWSEMTEVEKQAYEDRLIKKVAVGQYLAEKKSTDIKKEADLSAKGEVVKPNYSKKEKMKSTLGRWIQSSNPIGKEEDNEILKERKKALKKLAGMMKKKN